MYWRLNTHAKRNWVFLVWEGDKVPKYFLEECMNLNIEYIFVPSEHTKRAIINTEADLEIVVNTVIPKIKVIPHGVDIKKFYPKDKPEKFTFVANKGFRNLQDRGGIQYLIRAYMEEFTKEDNVELLLKINPAYGIPDLNTLLPQLKPREDNLPIMNIDTQNYPYEKLVDLYNKGHVFVSPTRAEAYNLGCIEAMACGLPVITTNFGGQTDFVNTDNGWLVGGELKTVEHEIMYEGIKWLTPNIEELRRSMREAYENKELVKQKSEKSILIAKENTWDKTSEMIKILEKEPKKT